jgi:hypothetical protein
MSEESLSQEELQRALREVFRRSQTDAEFRALCITDPHEALRLISGRAVPPDTTIRFVETAADRGVKPADPAT